MVEIDQLFMEICLNEVCDINHPHCKDLRANQNEASVLTQGDGTKRTQ